VTVGKVIVPHVRVLEAPAGEPITVAEAKTFCRVDTDDQDAVLELLIQAARERAEDITGRATVQRELELRLDEFPNNEVIERPYPPLISVDYIEYLDAAGDAQRLEGSPTSWIEDLYSEPGRIRPLAGTSWPATYEAPGAVRIGFTCGYAPYGSPADYGYNVPARMRQWMQARISTWFERREHLDLANVKDLPRDYVDGLLDGLKVNRGFA
jgi:uncharacterized phiE125 gp8 family phage protein